MVYESSDEAGTRTQIMDLIVAKGPITAASLAKILCLTSAAVRRHLSALEETGQISHREVSSLQRGRGRPARHYVATDDALEKMPKEYSDLASRALAYLQQVAGEEAIESFSATRGREVERRYAPVVNAAGPDPGARAQALADALTADGYAASVRDIGNKEYSVQLCQGNCPIQAVAGEFPQLCEAETAAFSRLLGVHVQRLATLAGGEHVCTINVPLNIRRARHLNSAAGSGQISGI